MNGIRAKKQYGQNFLTDDSIPKRIVRESGIQKSGGVIEIGPGLGILTKQLSAAAGKVVAVEIDHELIPVLNEKFRDFENVTVMEADIMKTDIGKLIDEELSGMEVDVVANLPYYITSPIIWKLVESIHRIRCITLMVQKEVAERLTSKAGTAEYGAMTVSLSYYAEVRKLFPVSAGHFSPRPKVDSAVISICPHAAPPVQVMDEEMLLACIRNAFQLRRKTLANGLSSGFGMSKQEVLDAIVRCGFRPDVRGEDLSLPDFAAIADELCKARERIES